MKFHQRNVLKKFYNICNTKIFGILRQINNSKSVEINIWDPLFSPSSIFLGCTDMCRTSIPVRLAWLRCLSGDFFFRYSNTAATLRRHGVWRILSSNTELFRLYRRKFRISAGKSKPTGKKEKVKTLSLLATTDPVTDTTPISEFSAFSSQPHVAATAALFSSYFNFIFFSSLFSFLFIFLSLVLSASTPWD